MSSLPPAQLPVGLGHEHRRPEPHALASGRAQQHPQGTTIESRSEFTPAQLIFAAAASLALYAVFIFVQAVRHRDYFLPAGDGTGDELHASPPSGRRALSSLGLMVVSLGAVVGLAKLLVAGIESVIATLGAAPSAVGASIAALVLAPEALAALRDARRDRIQVCMNLAYGSAMATIGLTIPTIALASIWLDQPLQLGIDSTQSVLLVISVIVGALTVLPGRATVQEGAVHLALLAAFLFLALSP